MKNNEEKDESGDTKRSQTLFLKIVMWVTENEKNQISRFLYGSIKSKWCIDLKNLSRGRIGKFMYLMAIVVFAAYFGDKRCTLL